MTTQSQKTTELEQYIKALETKVSEARKQADIAVQHYQRMREKFDQWLQTENARYAEKRTAQLNEIERLCQEMTRIRMQHTLDLRRYRDTWAKTFGY